MRVTPGTCQQPNMRFDDWLAMLLPCCCQAFRQMMHIQQAPESPSRPPLDSAGEQQEGGLHRSQSVTIGGLEGKPRELQPCIRSRLGPQQDALHPCGAAVPPVRA
jgi:hypothetical protein